MGGGVEAAREVAPSKTDGDALASCVAAVAKVTHAGTPVVLACPHTAEGVLAGVGVSYLARAPQRLVRLACAEAVQPQLGEACVALPREGADATAELAARVYRGLERHLSDGCPRARRGCCPATCDASCARRVVYACANDSPGAAQAVLAYARLAFAAGPAVRDMATDPTVARLDDLARLTLGECEHARQFVRFSHMADGSYLARFSCKADVVPFVAEHFARRMGTERFCLVDPAHGVAAFHMAGAPRAQVVALDDALARQLAARDDIAADEPYVRALWQTLYQGLSLAGRGVPERGYDLRAHWMPKRFWGGLTELAPRAAGGTTPLAVPVRYQG